DSSSRLRMMPNTSGTSSASSRVLPCAVSKRTISDMTAPPSPSISATPSPARRTVPPPFGGAGLKPSISFLNCSIKLAIGMYERPVELEQRAGALGVGRHFFMGGEPLVMQLKLAVLGEYLRQELFVPPARERVAEILEVLRASSRGTERFGVIGGEHITSGGPSRCPELLARRPRACSPRAPGF